MLRKTGESYREKHTQKQLCFTILALLALCDWLFAQTSVSGRVVFDEVPPRPETIQVKSETAVCGNTKKIHRLALGRDRGVADAVVRLVGVDTKVGPKPQEGKLDQIKCEYQPHVQILPVGSALKVTSSDPVVHSTHGFNEDGSTAFNVTHVISGMEIPTTIRQPGAIKIRCDAGHTWMRAYVIAVDHPYYALTDENGNFEIEDVPSGTYDIEIWHEWFGTHREPITIKDDRKSVTITLKKP